MAAVAEHTHSKLAGISAGETEFIETAVGLRETNLDLTGLDPGVTEDRERLGLGLKAYRILSPQLRR